MTVRRLTRAEKTGSLLNFVLLPKCLRTDHNQTILDRGNVVKNLFVGNLDSEVTLEELRRLFEAYGQVVQVHIVLDRDTGLPRGFAFVEMTNNAEAEKAIKALNGSILRDRTLDVITLDPGHNAQQPRRERTATPRTWGRCARMFPPLRRDPESSRPSVDDYFLSPYIDEAACVVP
jgi:hypothetical protein